MRAVRRALALGLGVWLIAPAASAHKPSDSYLTLRPSGAEVRGRWDIALRDLDDAVGLDADGDGVITWGEVQGRYAAAVAYALPRLTLRAGALPCTARPGPPAVVAHTDGTYLALELDWRCPVAAAALGLRYDLLFERDAQHRGIVSVAGAAPAAPVIFTAREREKTVAGAGEPPLAALVGLVRLGTAHILAGYDHLLFLLALLLPAVLRRDGGRWVPVPTFRATLSEVLRTVTAFTLAHSLTLGLAALGLVVLPSRWVESGIALSVVLAALNNLWPVVRADRWVAAFGLGLLHGFGFASALSDAGVAGRGLLTTLFGFNLGVEVGQVAVVALLLPGMYLARGWRHYGRIALGGGSVAVAAVATLWLVERVFAVKLSA